MNKPHTDRLAHLLLLIGLALMLFSGTALPTQAQDDTLSSADIDSISRAVVYIETEEGRFVTSTGSGTLVAPTGLIYTNRHVAEDADDYRIYLQSEVGELPELRYHARLVALYDAIDFAVLQIDRDEAKRAIDPDTLNLPHLDNFSEAARISDRVYILGYPSIGNGYLVVTQGSITSVENGTLYGQRLPLWYRSDAEISPGNSGGLAVNSAGQFVGVPTEVRKEDRTGGRLGGLLPYITLRTVLDNDAASDGLTQERANVTLRNDSDVTLCGLFVSPVTSTTWGDNLLAELPPGASASWRFGLGSYDLLLEDCDGVELLDQRGLELLEDVTVAFDGRALALADTDLPPPTRQAPRPTPESAAAQLSVELLDIEHNVELEGRNLPGMRITAYIRATGYRDVPLRVGVFFFWADNTPVSGSNAAEDLQNSEGNLSIQTLLRPAYNDTEWIDYWFWVPYAAFPLGFTGEQLGYAIAYIAPDGEPPQFPSNTIEYLIFYPE